MSSDPEEPALDEARLLAAKLESLAEFAAGAGHEINNPLATILGRVQLLLPGERDPERRQALLNIGGQAQRIRDMIGDVMLFARPPRPERTDIDLSDIARGAAGKLGGEIARRGCRLEQTLGEHVPVWGDPVQVAIVVANLVRNSLVASSSGGVIALRTVPLTDAAGARWSILTVADQGPGLSDLEREHLFDPFFSGRQAGRGLGFGLCKCWRIVQQHAGRIEVSSQPGGPTRFDVTWPAAAADAEQAAARALPTAGFSPGSAPAKV